MLNQKTRPEPDRLDRVLHALADASRRRLLEQLSRGPASVSQLAAPLPMSLPAVVQHLNVLESSGLIRTEKVGRVRTCHLQEQGLDTVQTWIDERKVLWVDRLDRLADFLEHRTDAAIDSVAPEKERS